MKKIILFLFFFLTLVTTTFAQQKHTFEIKGGNFLYDGNPIQIHSGEMHFARVPKAYWKQRLQMMKAMGLNTVATYVFWNYQETSPGVWDFKTGNKNIAEFIKTAQEVGLFVILRPTLTPVLSGSLAVSRGGCKKKNHWYCELTISPF